MKLIWFLLTAIYLLQALLVKTKQSTQHMMVKVLGADGWTVWPTGILIQNNTISSSSP